MVCWWCEARECSSSSSSTCGTSTEVLARWAAPPPNPPQESSLGGRLGTKQADPKPWLFLRRRPLNHNTGNFWLIVIMFYHHYVIYTNSLTSSSEKCYKSLFFPLDKHHLMYDSAIFSQLPWKITTAHFVLQHWGGDSQRSWDLWPPGPSAACARWWGHPGAAPLPPQGVGQGEPGGLGQAWPVPLSWSPSPHPLSLSRSAVPVMYEVEETYLREKCSLQRFERLLTVQIHFCFVYFST